MKQSEEAYDNSRKQSEEADNSRKRDADCHDSL